MKWIKDLFIIALIAILVSSLVKSCQQQEELEKLQIELTQANKIKDSLGNVITVKDAEIVTNQESMKDLRARLFQTTEKYNKKVKEVQALIAQGTEVVIQEVPVPYVDSVKMKQWEDSIAIKCKDVIKYYEDSTVRIGSKAKDSTAYYKIDATVEKQGIKMNEIKFIDSQYVALTKMKGGFFRKNTEGKFKLYVPSRTRVEIKHTNPYFQNTGVDAFLFDKKPKPSYGSGLVQGAVGGAALTILLLLLL
jgi:hypothetical protein